MADGLRLDADVNLKTANATKQWQRFERGIRTRTVNNGLGSITGNVKDFDKALGAATNRVVAFGAAAVVFNTLSRTFSNFVQSTIEVDQALTRINVNLNQSANGLKKFSTELFSVARQTGQTFQVAAKAAEELARQGLGAEETVKRLKDALILSRIAGIDSGAAVETLTAALNSFNREALTSTEVINKFVAVDTRFAVSSNDLAQAVSRVGSTAQAAGVDIDQLISLVTSLQQTTARGGAVIGNGLKTIFTRITAAPQTISALESVGVAITDTSGALRNGIDILKDYARARMQVGEAERSSLDRAVAGTFQINILKAALADLSRSYSVYDSALKFSTNATDEAIRKNEDLNKSISSVINSVTVSTKQFFASLGDQSVQPIIQSLFKVFESFRKNLSGEAGNQFGETLGKGIMSGITNVLTGPALISIFMLLGRSLYKVLSTIGGDIQGMLGLNKLAEARGKIQEKINYLLQNATAAEMAQLQAAKSVTAQKQVLLGVQARLNREMMIGNQLTNSFMAKSGTMGVMGGIKIDPRLTGSRGPNPRFPTFADPIASAMQKESAISGLPMSQIYVDRDARVSNASNPNGLLVANRRDEPAGGFQGVNRVLAQGGKPSLGSIPNFARYFAASDFPRGFNKSQIQKLNSMLKRAVSAPDYDKFLDELVPLTDIALQTKDRRVRDSILRISNEWGDEFTKRKQNAASAKIITSETTRENTGRARFKMRSNDPARAVRSAQIVAARTGGIVVAQDSRRSMLASEYYARQEARAAQVPYVMTKEDQIARDQKAKIIRQARRDRDLQKSDAKKALIQQKDTSRALGLAFAAPFLGGFVEPTIQSMGYSTAGGTSAGITSGGIGGALMGAGIGGFFGPKGLAVGAGVGAIFGALGKLKPSLEEFSKALDETVQVQRDSIEAIQRIVQVESQIADLGPSTNPLLMRKLAVQRAEIAGNIPDRALRERFLAGFGSNEERDKFTDEYQSKVALQEAQNNLTKELFSRQSSGPIGFLRNPFKTMGLGDTSSGKFLDEFFGGKTSTASKALSLLNPTPSFRGLGGRLADFGENLFFTPKEEASKRQNFSSLIFEQLKGDKVASGAFSQKGFQTLTSQVITGQGGPDTIKQFVAQLKTIGFDLTQFGEELTDAQVKDFAEASLGAAKRLREFEMSVKLQEERVKAEAAKAGLRKGAFLQRPNLEAALAGGRMADPTRNRFTSRTFKARGQYEFLEELRKASGLDEEAFTRMVDEDSLKKIKAGAQRENLTDFAIRFLEGQEKNKNVVLRNQIGDPSMNLITSLLKESKNDPGAATLLKFLELEKQNFANANPNLKAAPRTYGNNIITKGSFSAEKRMGDIQRASRYISGTPEADGQTLQDIVNSFKEKEFVAKNDLSISFNVTIPDSFNAEQKENFNNIVEYMKNGINQLTKEISMLKGMPVPPGPPSSSGGVRGGPNKFDAQLTL